MLGVGIGSGFTTASEFNLRVVTGQTEGEDFYQATTFEDAAAFLVEMIGRSCTGSSGMQKMIVSAGGPRRCGSGGGRLAVRRHGDPLHHDGLPGHGDHDRRGEGKVNVNLTYPIFTTTGSVTVQETQHGDAGAGRDLHADVHQHRRASRRGRP